MMTCLFSALLLIISSIACYFAYSKKEKEILSSMDMAYSYLYQEYKNIIQNYWQVYMPIFDGYPEVYDTLDAYFSESNPGDLSPLERRTLSNVLNQLKIRDNRIEWIALYSGNRSVNYIKYNNDSGVAPLDDSFPYLSELKKQTTQTEIYGSRSLAAPYGNVMTFAISGGLPANMGNGRIVVGYRLDSFHTADSYDMDHVASMRYYILANGQLIYDSFDKYDSDEVYPADSNQTGIVKYNGNRIYVKSGFSGTNTSLIVCSALWTDIFKAAHKDTIWLLSITFLFMGVSLLVHFGMSHSVAKEVSVIREGLDIISENHLDYRLPTNFNQGGLPEIAQNINQMSERLDENIKKAYYFELKQKDAELAQLQATFNPHFLYNTLEMLRSKSYANGDEDTSELIADLASIFRSFIGAKTFITLKEELNFTKKYLSLLSTRYGDKVSIRYDIEAELLNYGVIRNIFQILTENYFVHGFKPDNTDNLIKISGKSLDSHNMLLTVEDNGIGMEPENLSALCKKIEEPIRHKSENYGLKNLNQRLKLFYGPDYGLKLSLNNYGGLTIQIKLKKKTLDEYEASKRG